jgi:decaprenyl-phosphate phosphoribosyltransferase
MRGGVGITASSRSTSSLARSLLITARPRQWTKNLLVFAAPATGRVLLEPGVFADVILTFVAFTLTASGVYFVNDIIDRHEDAAHPRKRLRPIAAGELSVRVAATAGTILVAGGLVVAFVAGGPALVAVLGGYVALGLCYAFVLRRVALLDLAAIAGGFMLRAIAGGVAVDVHLSSWFLIVAAFGSLFIAASKRHAEFVRLDGARAGNERSSLTEYTEPYLRFVQYSASTVCITAYCLWAFEGAVISTTWSGLSIIPFALGIFRYALLVDSGRGETPEDLLLRDPTLLGLGAAWAAFLATGLVLS